MCGCVDVWVCWCVLEDTIHKYFTQYALRAHLAAASWLRSHTMPPVPSVGSDARVSTGPGEVVEPHPSLTEVDIPDRISLTWDFPILHSCRPDISSACWQVSGLGSRVVSLISTVANCFVKLLKLM